MALEGGEGSVSCPGRIPTPGKDPVPIVREAGWASGPVWTGAENLAPSGIQLSETYVHTEQRDYLCKQKWSDIIANTAHSQFHACIC